MLKRVMFSLAALLVASQAQATTLRCEKGLISYGDSTFDVVSKCGQPVAVIDRGYTEVRHGNRVDGVKVEEWIYTPSGGMKQSLRFQGGQLTDIQSTRNN
ncbi:DUF2845 domain-containing protein [Pseudomonas gingeri NCPPB 3146 = LMG 5327]|uniref:DUF2845 domain-containing protein n=2 Tax=Pseudomonas gingeri TaxID=117681 RepID=A0A7Y8CGB4_9PSED|nr:MULTISPECIES: DUF2845 domain-containing protein [Pseudomonas]NVZ27588.1 DUF2845 domain-containing protein [Pseudomonas gingeri]NVZ62781.1 DUF2845 domain-containing protein [Pseudomonas gingeri]NVZ74665.1 DUF2845 domain-containing protein [Pseudomonas gingeri]NWA08265.1 DUF2845 domain-containing protein [Pseudomonas gingeri]NWC18055.1 DUF2845 domain-containing protein [Pseudomonas gingeri]